jgi:DNA-directed RNA polymerase
MATPDQLARQLQRELDARSEAIRRLRERTKAAEDRLYASSTVYGTAFIKQGLEGITNEIAGMISRIGQGWATDKAAAIVMIKDCDPAVLALITAKCVLDVLGVRGTDCLKYPVVTQMIGDKIHDQIMLDDFQRKYPILFSDAKSLVHSHKGYRYKVQRYNAVMRKNGIDRLKWTTSVRHLVGGWLFDRLVEATGWVTVKQVYESPTKSQNALVYQPDFLKAKEALLAAG